VHLTAGQPARGTEITNIRCRNTKTKRNIFITNGLVCIKTKYQKNFVQYEYNPSEHSLRHTASYEYQQ
jgi:hypothetical protein